MKILLALHIIFALCNTLNNTMNMNEKDMQEGQCYTYVLVNDPDKVFGFILINIIKKKNGVIDHYEFALVNLNKNENITLNDFKQGTVYTHWIPSGKGKVELGILCYMFESKDKPLFDRFNYVGKLEPDKQKFVVGSTTSAFREPIFSNMIKQAHITERNMDKTIVSSILQ
jgi:hypothetical protein